MQTNLTHMNNTEHSISTAHKPPFTLLVNSSDGYKDCWDPFFTLLTTYWNPTTVPILLNTEHKTGYRFGDLNIRCTQAEQHATRRLTWSECLIEALSQVKTDFVLYMQEDYFIEQPVQHELIQELVRQMHANPEIKYIGLTHIGNLPPFEPWPADSRLSKVGMGRYRISTQAGLWRKDTLKSYLRSEENGWMFELYGTQRARRRNELFLTLNHETTPPAILYTHTGIIKGKWHQRMPALFAQHGITMDFSKRGIYRAKPAPLRKLETVKQLFSQPRILLRTIGETLGITKVRED